MTTEEFVFFLFAGRDVRCTERRGDYRTLAGIDRERHAVPVEVVPRRDQEIDPKAIGTLCGRLHPEGLGGRQELGIQHLGIADGARGEEGEAPKRCNGR